MSYPTTPFERAVDDAITQESARALATYCRACAGTGRIYDPPTIDGTRSWTRRKCPRCNGTGER